MGPRQLGRNQCNNLHAWVRDSWGETSATTQCILCWLCAAEATRLAPSKEACGLAVLETIVSDSVVALGASSTDAEVRLNAGHELVMVDACDTKSLLAACILLLANSGSISKSCLVISTASTCGLKAWLSDGRSEASATTQCILSWLGAAEATRLAPAKEAYSLAVLEAVVSDGVVALGASSADAKVGLNAGHELIVVDACHTKSLLAACILLLADCGGISQSSLVIGTASTCGLKAWL